jgi:hypothetical protein
MPRPKSGAPGQPGVGEKDGGCVLDVLDIRVGVLELPRLAPAFAEVPVANASAAYPRWAMASA